MNTSIKVGVYRRFEDRGEGQGEDPARMLALHNVRKAALHDVLDADPTIQVANWGQTDDSQPHEFVEILVIVAGGAALKYVVVPGVTWVGLKLAEKAVDTAVGELAKWAIAKLRPKQAAKEINDLLLRLPDGTTLNVGIPDGSATIRINFRDGTVESLDYVKAGA